VELTSTLSVIYCMQTKRRNFAVYGRADSHNNLAILSLSADATANHQAKIWLWLVAMLLPLPRMDMPCNHVMVKNIKIHVFTAVM